jgi:hypothetical protein
MFTTSLFSSRILEYLLIHKLFSEKDCCRVQSAPKQKNLIETVVDTACPVSAGIFREILQHKLPSNFVELALVYVHDIAEVHLVQFINVLACKLMGDKQFEACLPYTVEETQKLLLLSLSYSHTDVFADAALRSMNSMSTTALLSTLNSLMTAGEWDVAATWLNHLFDAHFTTFVVSCNYETMIPQLKVLQETLQSMISEYVTQAEDALGVVEWFLCQARRHRRQQVRTKYIGLDGSIRTKKAIVEGEKYLVEVIHF